MTTDPVASPQPSETAHAPDAYAVKERVAIGTAGVVYRAVQRSSGREVLFKVLMGQASHPLNTAQVLAIAPALMRLKGARVAELLDAYEDPEGTVLVYPLAPGTAGSEFPLKERLLTPPEARQVARQLCEALLAGERAAFPHGDLKPSNIVISEDTESGRLSVQVQDWGLSSCRTLQPPETMQFMAPERHHGHPTSVQGDLFSLGACLWFFITGQLPVASSTREELLVEWGAFDPGTLTGLHPEVDNHFRQWLSWLLRWQPRDRPPTVGKALEVLQQVIAFVDATEAKTASGSGNGNGLASPAQTQAPIPPSTETSATSGAASSLPAKPAVRRPTAPPTERLKQVPGEMAPPAASTPRPATSHAPSSAATVASSAPRERGSLASKLMGAVLVCCVLAAVGVLFVWWAEEEWGPDWRTEMVASLKSRLRTTSHPEPALAASPDRTGSSPPAAPSSKNASSKPSGSTAHASAQKPAPKSVSAKLAPKQATPASPSPGSNNSNNNKPISAVELFEYANGVTLEGAAGGKGWKTPWKATQAVKGETSDGTYQGILLSAAAPSSISRELAPGNTFSNGSVAVALDLWHPGANAAPLELDLLGTADSPSGSPIIISPIGNRLKISIKDGTEDLQVHAGAPLKLVLKWSFKRKPDGMADVVVDVYVNPKPGASNPVALSPTTKKDITGYKLPASLTFTARTIGTGSTPVVLQKMWVAKTAKDAIK